MLLSLFYSFSIFVFLSIYLPLLIKKLWISIFITLTVLFLRIFVYSAIHISTCVDQKIFISFLSNDRIRMAFRVDCRCRCRHEDEKVREKTNRRTKWQNHERVFVKHPLLIWWLSEVNNIPVSQAGVLLDPMSITYDFDMEPKFEAGSRSIFLGSNPVSEHFTSIYSTFDW